MYASAANTAERRPRIASNRIAVRSGATRNAAPANASTTNGSTTWVRCSPRITPDKSTTKIGELKFRITAWESGNASSAKKNSVNAANPNRLRTNRRPCCLARNVKPVARKYRSRSTSPTNVLKKTATRNGSRIADALTRTPITAKHSAAITILNTARLVVCATGIAARLSRKRGGDKGRGVGAAGEVGSSS